MKLKTLLPILSLVFGIAFLVSFTATKAHAKYIVTTPAPVSIPVVNTQECGCTYNGIQCNGETWPSGYVCCAEGVPCRYYKHKYFVVCLQTGVYGYECSCAYWCANDTERLMQFLYGGSDESRNYKRELAES